MPAISVSGHAALPWVVLEMRVDPRSFGASDEPPQARLFTANACNRGQGTINWTAGDHCKLQETS